MNFFLGVIFRIPTNKAEKGGKENWNGRKVGLWPGYGRRNGTENVIAEDRGDEDFLPLYNIEQVDATVDSHSLLLQTLNGRVVVSRLRCVFKMSAYDKYAVNPHT